MEESICLPTLVHGCRISNDNQMRKAAIAPCIWRVWCAHVRMISVTPAMAYLSNSMDVCVRYALPLSVELLSSFRRESPPH
jgi:hypothetical protein